MASPAAAARDEEKWMKNKKKKTTGGKESGGRWPQIKRKRDLQINRLKGNSLFTIPHFFTAAEAKSFIEAAESVGFVHQGSLGPAKGEAYRDNDRISVSDPVLAECIWGSGLKKVFDDIKVQDKVAVGLNQNIRFYRYKVGQRFGRHIDESVDFGEGRKTKYTLLIYLSGSEGSKVKKGVDGNQESFLQSLAGGETVFYDQRQGIVAEVAPVEGMALLHIHGAKCMLHEARAVSRNVKYCNGEIKAHHVDRTLWDGQRLGLEVEACLRSPQKRDKIPEPTEQSEYTGTCTCLVLRCCNPLPYSYSLGKTRMIIHIS